jgi:hypothetical protein
MPNGLLTPNTMLMTGLGLLSTQGRPEGAMQGLLQAQKMAYQQEIMKEMQAKRQLAEEQQAAQQRMAGLMSSQQIPGGGPLNANPQPAYAANPAEQQMMGDLATGSPDIFQQMLQQRFAPTSPKGTDDIREYQFARSQGFQGSLQDWLNMTKKPLAQITNQMGKDFTGELGKGMAESVVKDFEKMSDMRAGLDNISKQRDLLDAGMKTGVLANFKLGFGKVLQEAGINFYPDEVANTEAYLAATAKETANIIQEFGAGTGLSDADREYAEKAAAGKITMTEASLRKILEIREKASRNLLKRYNRKVNQLKSSQSEKILF